MCQEANTTQQFNPALSGLGRKLAAEAKERSVVDQMQIAGAALAGRQSGKDALRELVARKFGEAERLNRFLQSLPGEMNPAADEALWDLVRGAR